MRKTDGLEYGATAVPEIHCRICHDQSLGTWAYTCCNFSKQ